MAMETSLQAQQALVNHQLRYAKKGLYLGIISGAAWGLDGVLLTIAGYLAPFWIKGYSLATVIVACLASAAMHDLFAGGWVAIYNIVTGRWVEYARSLRTKPGKIILLGALFGGPIGMGSYLIALNLAGATYAISISAIYPAVGAILGVIFLKEKINFRVWVGIIACMAGAYVVSYTPPQGGLEDFPYFYLGIFFSFLPVVGWALEGVIATFGMDLIDSDVALGLREIFSGFTLLILVVPLAGLIVGAGLAGWDIFAGAFKAGVPMMWVAVAGLAGGLSYVAWYKSLNMTGVGRAMAFNVTYPLWSILFGIVFSKCGLYSYSITVQGVIGACIITFGTLLVVANPKELLKLRN